MRKRFLLLVLIGLLVAGFRGKAHTETEPPPYKPLPAPITIQESRSFPHPLEIFIRAPDYGVWSGYYQNGTKPEIVVKTHPTAIGMIGEAAVGTAPYYCEDCFRYNMEIAHAWGMKHSSRICAETNENINEVDPQTRANLLQAGCISIDGNTIGSGDANLFKLCTNNPVWREHLVEVAKRSIAWGADGIHIDAWQGTHMSLDKPGNGCFCQYCMEGFREYLRAKYSAEELRGFGILDIDSFNYGDFIRVQYLTLYNDTRWEVPLFRDFETYQLKSITQFWSEAIEEIRAYGITLGKEIYFSANTAQLYVNTLPIAYALDYLAPEYTYGFPPNSRSIPDYKIGISLGTPVLTLPQSHSSQTVQIMTRPDATNLWKIYTAEAYSARGFAIEPYGYPIFWTENPTTFDGNIDDLKPYYDFIVTNNRYYENRVSTARTAVVYAYYNNYWWGGSVWDFYGICNLLLDAHFQYDVLFSGDDEWMEDKLTLNALQRYEVVVLPNTISLSDRQVDLLLSYVRLGGSIIAFGEIGAYSKWGQEKVERPELESLLTEGSHNYGLGKFVYMPGQVGSNYLNTRDAPVRQQFSEALGGLIYPNIQTDASENVAILEYWNSKTQSVLLHLINYDYDLEKQQINSRKNIDIEVLLYEPLSGKNLALFYSSPDWKNVERLKYEMNGGKVKFTIPKLDFYAVVTIGKISGTSWIPLLLLDD